MFYFPWCIDTSYLTDGYDEIGALKICESVNYIR